MRILSKVLDISKWMSDKAINRYFSFNSRQRSKKIESVSAHVLEKMDFIDQSTPIEKGYNYLIDSCNAKRCFQPYVSQYSDFRISHKSPFPEIFDTALILDTLNGKQFDSTIVQTCLKYLRDHRGTNKLFSFFEDPRLLPQDVDDTALATLMLMNNQKISPQDAKTAADAIIANVNDNGIIQTYFSPRGGRDGRIDPSVCANALRLIHQLGQGNESLPTENYLYSFLEKTGCLDNVYYGNRLFFYFMWEAMKISGSLKNRFISLFANRLISDIGSSANPIDLASRVIVSTEMGLSNDMEIDKLYRLQQKDGSWPIDIAYTGSRKNLYWGSKAISTAFALRALDNEKTIQLKNKLFSLPVLSMGFEIVDGLLKYGKTFSPLSLKSRVIVVTHPETFSTQASKFYESDKQSPNNSLTEKGKQEALSIGKRLKKEIACHPIIIYHADNTRTFETAQIIKGEFPDSIPQSVSWLNEINCFDWHGRDTQEVLETDFLAQAMFLKSNCLAKASKGQSFLEYLNEVYNGLRYLQSTQNETSKILLCTSRVALVAIKILVQIDVEFDSQHHIDWSAMARTTKTGTVFNLF